MRKQHKNKKTLGHVLKHLFIAGKHNHFHPHSLRPIGLVTFALILAFIPTFYNIASAGRMQVLGYASNINISDIYALGNQERANAGLGSLSLNSTLSTAAYNKAQDMFTYDYWAHNNPTTGATPWDWIHGAGYVYTSAGENLAKNFATSAGVMNGWMNSSGHRANVLGDYQDVGYAVVNGVLGGEETTLVVAEYGKPYTAPVAPTAPATPSTPAQTEAPATVTETPKTTAETPTTTAEPTPTTTPEESTAPAETENNTATESSPTTAASTTPAKDSATPAVEGLAVITNLAPVKAYTGLNWGQKASLFVLSTLLLLFIMKHTIVWRVSRGSLRDIWLRAHPMAQGSILVVAIIITLASGTGSIL